VDEAQALGLDDYLFGNGVCLIEWAERIRPVLPDQRLWITLRHLDVNKRGIVMRSTGIHYDELLREFRRTAFGV
jgi:tRNA threonylcarbamoyladenosine biosynthesis protein TsaE